MSGEAFVEKAVEALHSAISSGLVAKLRAVETAQGLTASSLTDPVAILRGRFPNDNRSPLVWVHANGWEYTFQRQRYMAVDCTVVVAAVGGAGPTGPTDLEVFLERYTTALIRTIEADPSLGSKVSAALITDGESAASSGDSSATRMVHAIGVEVRVHSP